MAFTLPELPYAPNALEPFFDEATMRLHHGKHHQTYVNNLNAAIEKHNELDDLSLEELLTDLKTSNSEKVRYNAARVLGEMGDSKAVEPLIDVLKNDNMRYRGPGVHEYLSWDSSDRVDVKIPKTISMVEHIPGPCKNYKDRLLGYTTILKE